MCERCVEIDAEIKQWKRLARDVTDWIALGLIRYEIEEAKEEKDALHPEQSFRL